MTVVIIIVVLWSSLSLFFNDPYHQESLLAVVNTVSLISVQYLGHDKRKPEQAAVNHV